MILKGDICLQEKTTYNPAALPPLKKIRFRKSLSPILPIHPTGLLSVALFITTTSSNLIAKIIKSKASTSTKIPSKISSLTGLTSRISPSSSKHPSNNSISSAKPSTVNPSEKLLTVCAPSLVCALAKLSTNSLQTATLPLSLSLKPTTLASSTTTALNLSISLSKTTSNQTEQG